MTEEMLNQLNILGNKCTNVLDFCDTDLTRKVIDFTLSNLIHHYDELEGDKYSDGTFGCRPVRHAYYLFIHSVLKEHITTIGGYIPKEYYPNNKGPMHPEINEIGCAGLARICLLDYFTPKDNQLTCLLLRHSPDKDQFDDGGIFLIVKQPK